MELPSCPLCWPRLKNKHACFRQMIVLILLRFFLNRCSIHRYPGLRGNGSRKLRTASRPLTGASCKLIHQMKCLPTHGVWLGETRTIYHGSAPGIPRRSCLLQRNSTQLRRSFYHSRRRRNCQGPCFPACGLASHFKYAARRPQEFPFLDFLSSRKQRNRYFCRFASIAPSGLLG